jgi:drug/metabolite transporter (DMT)-like permease
VFYSYSIQIGIFVSTVALVALLPASMALIGFFYFKDRMTFLKTAGILLSISGAIVITLL